MMQAGLWEQGPDGGSNVRFFVLFFKIKRGFTDAACKSDLSESSSVPGQRAAL